MDLELYQPCAPNIHPVDDWWSSEVPAISADLVPFVREFTMRREATPICDFGVWYQEAMGRLRTEGSDKRMQQAAAAQIMWPERHPRSAGRTCGKTVGWGDFYPLIDYIAQELRIGNLYFLCIDMGYEIPLGVHLRTSLGEPDKVEKNQCACVHMALGLEWMAQGGPRRIPEKNRAMEVATQIRSAEYQQAQEFMMGRSLPYSKVTVKLFSLAHDAMTSNHDRNFHDIHLFLAGLGMGLHQHVVRIFDLEWRDNQATINVHQLGDLDQQTGLDASINLIALRGHVRFLLPSSDTRPTSWRDWQQQVGNVIVHEWIPWQSVLADDDEKPRVIHLYPCSTCYKMRRSILPELDAGKDQSVG